jgi:UDP-glucose 4-epimerase
MTMANHDPILVTGGAGFVGSHLARTLLRQGRDVHVLDNLSTGTTSNLTAGVIFHNADLRSDDDLLAVFAAARYGGIVHCAAQTSVARSMADPQLDYETNVEGTGRLVSLAREHGVGRFVFISSGGAIYGDTSGAASEDAPAAPLSHYGRNKLAAEGLLREAGISHAILRPANIYGPGQRSDLEGGVIAVFTERVLAGQGLTVHGDGLQSRDFVHVADVVRAIQAALACGEDVTWNVASGVSTTVLQLVSLLREVTESAVDVTFAEARAGDVRHSLLSAERLVATGWGPPRDLRDGLRQLVELQREGAANGEVALKLLRSTSRIIRPSN